MSRLIVIIMFLLISSSTSILYADSPILKKPKPQRDNISTSTLKPAGYNGSESQTSLMYFNKGITSARSGNFDEAIENYILAIEADSMFVEAYDNLGRAFRGKGELDSAIYYYKKSLSLYPEGIFANQNLGVAYLAKQDFEMATKTYKHIIDILPDSPEGYYGLAQTKLITSKYDEAMAAVDIAIEKYKESNSDVISDGYLTKAFIYHGLKDEANMKKYLVLAKENGANLSPALEAIIKDEASSDSGTDTLDHETLIKAIDWYLETPISDETAEKRKAISESLVLWMIETPHVSVIVDSTFVEAECPECLIVFMIAWTKYTLENDAKDKPIDCCYYATRTTTGFYSKNKDQLGQIAKYEELIELELDGELKNKVIDTFEILEKAKK